jgi:signal transduction histidine kinase
MVFGNLTRKLLFFTLSLSLIPLIIISWYSYNLAKNRVTADRIKLYLEQIARDTADKIDIMLQEKREDVLSMLAVYSHPHTHQALTPTLNTFCRVHEVYDLLIITDMDGVIVAMNTQDRFGSPIREELIQEVVGHNISEFPAEQEWFQQARLGIASIQDWYRSDLVKKVYAYQNDDLERQYNIAFSRPIQNVNTGKMIGIWCNIMNWEFVQRILDRVEDDLEITTSYSSGYAFLLKGDGDTTIGHKFRTNREYHPQDTARDKGIEKTNNYGVKISQRAYVRPLYEAIKAQARSVTYESPPGNKKTAGLAKISDPLGWTCGVGINDADIFEPVRTLKNLLILAAILVGILVVSSTYVISHGITVPLRRLTSTAEVIAQGDLSQRVQVTSHDEVGILGRAFNEMAHSLDERNKQLLELTQNLEEKVKERTLQLERSNEELKKAYLELKATQEQLVHSEKLASLGQLVAGIAHEIKNPLNFIYGNTGFLMQYVENLKHLIKAYDGLSTLRPEDKKAIQRMKEVINYDFIVEDLKTLIENFNEGANRINAIVSDLRSFSRMDFDTVTEVDVHASLDTALNLLRNEYRGRIAVHKEYAKLPKISGYAGKLNQVFMNLLANAIQAIEQRGDIWINTAVKDGHVIIKIKDSGIGIPQHHLNKIFEPFFTTKKVGQGTGLGLSISYGIIEQHHGKIFVESEVGKGSTFTIKLPVTANPELQGQPT